MPELTFVNQDLDHVDQLVDLEARCFPELPPHELVSPETVQLQVELFQEGAFMVLDGDRVVGMASGVFVDYDIRRTQHRLVDVVGAWGVGNHDPDGDWYYGIDIAVDPDYRGRGIAKELYRLRKQVVIDHNKRGIIAGGVLPGYADHKHEMSAIDYVAKVVDGELVDPTLTAQLKSGFTVLGLIADYIDSPSTDNWASFITWFNLRFDPDAP
jgi:GNAT superfamily N-acetyltransferase